MESTDDYIFVGNMKTGVFRYPPAMVKEFGLPGEVVENAAAFWGGKIHPYDCLLYTSRQRRGMLMLFLETGRFA